MSLGRVLRHVANHPQNLSLHGPVREEFFRRHIDVDPSAQVIDPTSLREIGRMRPAAKPLELSDVQRNVELAGDAERGGHGWSRLSVAIPSRVLAASLGRIIGLSRQVKDQESDIYARLNSQDNEKTIANLTSLAGKENFPDRVSIIGCQSQDSRKCGCDNCEVSRLAAAARFGIGRLLHRRRA